MRTTTKVMLLFPTICFSVLYGISLIREKRPSDIDLITPSGTETQLIELVFWLVVGHALADFTLQTDIMAKLKSRHNRPNWIPDGQKYVPTWGFWLSAHGLIHGGFVFLITGIVWFGIVETVLHCLIDFAKCENITTPYQDQLLHYLSKIPFVLVLL